MASPRRVHSRTCRRPRHLSSVVVGEAARRAEMGAPPSRLHTRTEPLHSMARADIQHVVRNHRHSEAPWTASDTTAVLLCAALRALPSSSAARASVVFFRSGVALPPVTLQQCTLPWRSTSHRPLSTVPCPVSSPSPSAVYTFLQNARGQLTMLREVGRMKEEKQEAYTTAQRHTRTLAP